MQYAWLIWSLSLAGVWLALYLLLDAKDKRKEMLVVSWWTSLLGLTEPLFVPEYWSSPSLFDLALKTGFDIESLLFAFGIGGIAAVVYERLFPVVHEQMAESERHLFLHRYHLLALLSAPASFFLLLSTDANPIYSAIAAMILGGLFSWYCRPDLKKKMLASAALFSLGYFLYFLTLIIIFPGYVDAVWNFSAISGILIGGVPLEEIAFAASLGFFWSSVYEHVTWRRIHYES